MKPLICPQCGAKILKYDPRGQFAHCDYCGTKFQTESQISVPRPVRSQTFELPIDTEPEPGFFGDDKVKVIGFAMLIATIFVVIGVISFSARRSQSVSAPSFPSRTPSNVYETRPSLIITPAEENLVDFGGKGDSNGVFRNASSIAVGRDGRIYIADDTLRVQEFNEIGDFIRVRQIPATGKFYQNARSIQKIAVDGNGRLYVLIGGVLQVWGPKSTAAPDITHQTGPDPIVDFALRVDGSLNFVSVGAGIETLAFATAGGRVTKRISGFVTEHTTYEISPVETALAALRITTDNAGGIYALHAFGDLASYEINYEDEDLQVYRYSPQGKFVGRFLPSLESVGIAIDSRKLVYVSDNTSVEAHDMEGEYFDSTGGFSKVVAFALDKDNNIYVIDDDRIIKRAAFSSE